MSTVESDKISHVFQNAQTLYSSKPDWVVFYSQILGPKGMIRQAFPGRDELAEFEQTAEYLDIHRMLTDLRKQKPVTPPPEEPTHVITVRIPKSLHDALKDEAYELRTSMNKLCISKLLQMIDNEMVPAEK